MKTPFVMRNAECGMRSGASGRCRRTTGALSRFGNRRSAATAFTLIELLVVIGIIAILAALTLQGVKGLRKSITLGRARAELVQVETAIERYHDKRGYYPPDNAPNWDFNQLYYELLGTAPVPGGYQTLDKSSQIIVPTAFGPNVTAFRNCSQAGGDDTSVAVPYLKGLKPSQFLTVPAGCTLLGAGIDGPLTYPGPTGVKFNPWRYNSSNPRFSTKSFDLWIDVIAGNLTNRVSNWSDKPLIVTTPY